jgi:hypothetical protein
VRRPLASFFRSSKRRTSAADERSTPDSRAAELRRKLAESRALVDERDSFESAEPTVDQTEHAPDDPERRRQDVHGAGRAIEREMRQL